MIHYIYDRLTYIRQTFKKYWFEFVSRFCSFTCLPVCVLQDSLPDLKLIEKETTVLQVKGTHVARRIIDNSYSIKYNNQFPEM